MKIFKENSIIRFFAGSLALLVIRDEVNDVQDIFTSSTGSSALTSVSGSDSTDPALMAALRAYCDTRGDTATYWNIYQAWLENTFGDSDVQSGEANFSSRSKWSETFMINEITMRNIHAKILQFTRGTPLCKKQHDCYGNLINTLVKIYNCNLFVFNGCKKNPEYFKITRNVKLNRSTLCKVPEVLGPLATQSDYPQYALKVYIDDHKDWVLGLTKDLVTNLVNSRYFRKCQVQKTEEQHKIKVAILKNISKEVYKELTRQSDRIDLLETLIKHKMNSDALTLDWDISLNEITIHSYDTEILQITEKWLNQEINTIRERLRNQEFKYRHPLEGAVSDKTVVVENGAVVKNIEWDNNRKKVLNIYGKSYRSIIESDLSEFGAVESLQLQPENLFKHEHLVHHILHQGEWYTECGSVHYWIEESTLVGLMSHVMNPGEIIFKRPKLDEVHRKSFKGAVVKLKWPLRPITKVKIHLEDVTHDVREVQRKSKEKMEFKIKLNGNTEIKCKRSKTNQNIYHLTGNFGSLSDEELNNFLPKKLEEVLCNRRTKKITCERAKFRTGYHHRCEKGFERKLLSLYLQKWNLNHVRHLSLSDFRIEVQNYNSEKDDFVHIDMIYFSRHTVENFITVKGDGGLKFGKVLDREIVFRKVTEPQSVSENTDFYYQMALPSKRAAEYFRSRASGWMKSQPEKSDLRMTTFNQYDDDKEFLVILRDAFVIPKQNEQPNLKPPFKIDACYDFLDSILKTTAYQSFSENQGYVTGVSVVALDEIGKLTDTCIEKDFDTENKQRIYAIYGDDKNKASARKLLEDTINSNDVQKVLMLHNSGKDSMTALLRTFGSRLNYTTDGRSQITRSFTNPVLNLTREYVIYYSKDDDIVKDIRQLLQVAKLERKSLGDCGSCFCEIDQESTKFTLSICGHSFHTECIQEQISVALTERHFPIQCVECEENLFWKDIILPDDVGSDKLPDEQLKNVLLSMTIDFVMKSKGTLKCCITPDCPGIYNVKAKDGDIRDQPELHACSLCGVTFCTRCQEPIQEQHYCSGVLDDLMKEWMSENETNRKRCPVCHFGIEKVSGCNRVYCTICKTMLCWKCLKVFEASTIYKHLNEVHGGAYH